MRNYDEELAKRNKFVSIQSNKIYLTEDNSTYIESTDYGWKIISPMTTVEINGVSMEISGTVNIKGALETSSIEGLNNLDLTKVNIDTLEDRIL